MFLDEELLMIGRSCDQTEKSIIDCVSKMINVSFQNLNKRLEGNKTDTSIMSGFRRVNKTWQMVADKLESEGISLVKREGFRLYVESKPEFKNVFFNK